MRLIAKSNHQEKEAEVLAVTRDGWVITETGAYGDNGVDCNISLEGEVEYIRSVKRRLSLSQQEIAWILNVSRPTVSELLKGKRGLTLREYAILQRVVDGTRNISKSIKINNK